MKRSPSCTGRPWKMPARGQAANAIGGVTVIAAACPPALDGRSAPAHISHRLDD